MSGSVFPKPIGTRIEVKRSPVWSTKTMRALSGREQRIGWYNAPLYEYEMKIEFLRQGIINGKAYAEAKTIVDFFNAMQGSFDDFWLDDPFDGTQHKVRFKNDRIDVERFLSNFWEIKTLNFVEVRP